MRLRPLATTICGVFLVIVATACTHAAEAESIGQQLDGYMQVQVKRNHFTGTVLVARNTRIILARGYGYANAEWRTPNTLRTKFRLGSLTKQFTATAIMQLRERGLLDLQDSICKHVQPFGEVWMPVTLHHLLSHTSGIAGYGQRADPFRNVSLEFAPGARWQYSDWGYCLLGLVIENVTGKPYAQVLREQIFDPLGMHDTGYDRDEKILEHRAAGYRLVNGQLENAGYIDMAGPYAAGGLYSTADDLYKWDRALYTESILPRNALGLMWTEVLSNYGYGWMVSTPESASKPPWALPNRFQVVHPGSINGFTSEILRFPNEHVTVIVLANLQDAHVVGPELAAMVLGDSYSLASPHARDVRGRMQRLQLDP
ncbi:MAG TPA: serine hydrolase domain-containing protein [Steroidobacteraceae bacterium]|nr:serine hydrolase domain-containing protein [Steroidobacteraceae bacterium]